jgi:predicted oxidoreductase
MTNNKQQSAVDIIYQGMSDKIVMQDVNKALICIHISHDDFIKLHRQAKKMEKEQRSIELPSDEEIGKEASVRHYGTNFKHVFASGAKWMRDKIQGGEQ